MSTHRHAPRTLLAFALAMVASLPVGAQGVQAQGAQDQVAHATPASEHRALSDAVRRVERATNGQVLSAERVQFDGRDVNRVKIIDDRGRVRVYWDDPQSRAERVDRAGERDARIERARRAERAQPAPRRDDPPPRRTRRHDGAAFNL